MTNVLIILYLILQVYAGFLTLNIFLSWIPKLYEYKFFRFCKIVSDFYLGPFHGAIVIGPLDLTPMIGIGVYQMVMSCLAFLIYGS